MKRSGQDGQALLLALVVLLVTSLAAALAAGALAAEQRARIRRAESVRVRALLDAALSTGVARLVEDASYRGHVEEFGGGRLALEVDSPGTSTVTLQVLVRFRSRAAGGRATVALLGAKGPRVVRWEPLPASTLPASLRRRAR